MKFALIKGERQEAHPNLYGKCPSCDHVMVAKCGVVRIWHWAHQRRRMCDPWWENETEWHRAWKGQFPESCQEVVHSDVNGVRHIADVRTERGWVIEFQHSHIKPEERRSRDAFYSKLVWVVNGTRRKKDEAQLYKALNEGTPVGSSSPVRRVSFDGCALIREWAGSDVPVFFDFGKEHLWWLLAARPGRQAYVAPFLGSLFIAIHRDAITEATSQFDELVMDLGRLIAEYESHARAQALQAAALRAPSGFQQHLVRRNRFRRRL